MTATDSYGQVGARPVQSARTRAEALASAAYHLARARRELLTGDPVELARRSNGAARGLPVTEVEARIRAFQSGHV